MIPVSTLYDEYIDRPKLSKQKKPFEFTVPPQEGSEQKDYVRYFSCQNAKFLTSQRISFVKTNRSYCAYFTFYKLHLVFNSVCEKLLFSVFLTCFP